MFCKKCGATVKSNETFCPSCGEYISKSKSETPLPQPNNASPTMIQYFLQNAKPQGGSSFLWINLRRTAAWMQFFIILIGGLVFLFKSDSDYAVIISLLSVAIALLSISGVMINLDKAEDIRNIRSTLELMYSESNNSDCNNEKK